METTSEETGTTKVSAADRAAKEDAHQKLTILNELFDMYNTKELEADTKYKTILKIFLQEAQEGKELIAKLLNKTNSKATRAYMIFTARLIIRLSSLIHNDRVETADERVEHIRNVKKKYGMDNLTQTEMMLEVEADL